MNQRSKIKEIDIVRLVFVVLKQWRYLLRFAIAGAVIGLIVAFSIPRLFCSSVVLAPEFSPGSIGLSNSLSDLASSFGVNIGSNKTAMDAIYPDLYPDIFESTEFIQSLYDVPVRLKDDDTQRTYLTHILEDTKIPWWDYPKVWLAELLKPSEPFPGKGNGKADPYAMNQTQWNVYKSVSSSINCEVDKKTSVIKLSVTDQDPLVAAIIADTLLHYLQDYITDYRTNKARTDLKYYTKLATDAKQDYERVRQRYGSYSDANMDVVLTSYRAKQEDLENDMQLKFNTYSVLQTQLQQARAKVQERTPAFTIIQPAKINPKPVSTPKIVILLIWIVIGTFVGSGMILWKEYKKQHTTSIAES